MVSYSSAERLGQRLGIPAPELLETIGIAARTAARRRVEGTLRLDEADRLLRRGWNELPFSSAAREWGDRWVETGASLGMMVPSVVMPREWNVLINPGHSGFAAVRILQPETAAVDRRLLR